ncbi:Tautomerase/MIF [Favolaschia claudopus]|uniref:Tautomerase/MIF n=1 Tax=Favolaschia claudopus TaxID=2862362 RepID=A0AAW0CBP0_9AGAR
MLYLLLLVNVQIADEAEFARQFSKISAQALEKPKFQFTTNITYNRNTGTVEAPIACGLTILGFPDHEDAQEKCSEIYADFFSEKLDIAKERVYIRFHSPSVPTTSR